MTHCYFGNLGKRAMALPDSEVKAHPRALLWARTLTSPSGPLFVSATSIFSLPEVHLEKETVRPTVSADPGSASVLSQSPVVEGMKENEKIRTRFSSL